MKCGESTGGAMVQCMNGYAHIKDCKPGTVLLSEPPVFSKSAKLVYNLPDALRKIVEKRTGAAKEIAEIGPDGEDKGNVLGYTFYKTSV